METGEELQIQPKISPNRIEFQEIAEKGEIDRISALPDCLVLEILSRLPSTKDAIRTGTLSTRWKHIWTCVPTLIFSNYEDDLPWSDFVSFIDKTLAQCRQLKLKAFILYARQVESESEINNWIHFAIRCNVEELYIVLRYMNLEVEFQLPQFFFISSCFTRLTLDGCTFNPSVAISWKSLRGLWISNVNLDEDVIENILSGSPVLESLILDDCRGYRRLDITSKSVKNLMFSGFIFPFDEYGASILEINAPNISSLTILGDLYLSKLLLVNVSSLVKAELAYRKKGHYTTTTRKEANEEMLKELILSLGHVKELKVEGSCSKVMSRLEAKGFAISSNVKLADDYYERMEEGDWSDSDSDSVESEDQEAFYSMIMRLLID